MFLSVSVGVGVVPRPARADDDSATAEARSHYEMGLKLFDARSHEQALIEFEKANELKTRPASLFMMAQCEYLLGRLKEARGHYQRYFEQNPDGEFAALARDRVEAIDKRPSTFVINTVPDDVTVRISLDGQTGVVVAGGQAPNNFSVPRGRYRVDVVKPNYQGQTRIVDVDVAETKPLFFKLEPIPARLEIETTPPDATLYVNGNRARNPYRQEIAPGSVEIFAEAPNYLSRTVDLSLAPSEHRVLTGDSRFTLSYKQRSGRPELIFASALLGGFVGAGAVAAAIGKDLDDQNVASVLLATGGGISGAVVGGLLATAFVPQYIPDNRALLVIGGMWIGAAEGFGVGVVGRQIATYEESDPSPCQSPCRGSVGNYLRVGFEGSLPGLALGLTTGALLAKRAPTYGRVTLIQSAALGGAVTGALAQIALQWHPYGSTSWNYTVRQPSADESSNSLMTGTVPTGHAYVKSTSGGPAIDQGCTYVSRPNMTNASQPCAFTDGNSVLDLAPGILIGLNVGLAAGLLGAYLPDQSSYGPSWKRVLLIDLAAGAGAVAGGVFGCVFNVDGCLSAPQPTSEARSIAAWAALGGAGLGVVGGILLTRGFDDDVPSREPTPSTMPMATFVPMRGANGAMVPAFAAMGSF
jgi:PEGA domain